MMQQNNIRAAAATTDDTTARLRVLYSGQLSHPSQGTLTKLGRVLFPLARRLGIDNPHKIRWQERHTIYTRAIAAGLIDEATEADIRALLDRAEAESEYWRRLEAELSQRARAAEEARTAARRDAPRSAGRLYTLTVTDSSLGNLGLVRGDLIDVRADADLKPGDAAAIERKGSEIVACGRVFACDAERITLVNDHGTLDISRAEIVTAGRVDLLNVRKADPPTSAQRSQVEQCRVKLIRLGREDDQITRCSERYKLEKTIFDIEHPTDDGDDWSAWEEGNQF